MALAEDGSVGVDGGVWIEDRWVSRAVAMMVMIVIEGRLEVSESMNGYLSCHPFELACKSHLTGRKDGGPPHLARDTTIAPSSLHHHHRSIIENALQQINCG